jgi:hypothetical protein
LCGHVEKSRESGVEKRVRGRVVMERGLDLFFEEDRELNRGRASATLVKPANNIDPKKKMQL